MEILFKLNSYLLENYKLQIQGAFLFQDIYWKILKIAEMTQTKTTELVASVSRKEVSDVFKECVTLATYEKSGRIENGNKAFIGNCGSLRDISFSVTFLFLTMTAQPSTFWSFLKWWLQTVEMKSTITIITEQYCVIVFRFSTPFQYGLERI